MVSGVAGEHPTGAGRLRGTAGRPGRHDPVFVISVAAEMAGMHPQTLRQYDRLGLVVPQRQGGRHRRYSAADVEHLRAVQRLSREGVSLEGIRRILDLQREVERLQDTVVELASQVDRLHSASALARVFSVGLAGDVSARYAAPAAHRAAEAVQGQRRPGEGATRSAARGGLLRALPAGRAAAPRGLTRLPAPRD